MTVIVEKQYGWKSVQVGNITCWYVGYRAGVRQFISYCERHPHAGPKELGKVADAVDGNFSLILQQADRIIGVVDKVRSYPVFYFSEKDAFCMANSARAIRRDRVLKDIEDLSLLEFRMAGYVTGRHTIFRNLYQLQAGELVLWDGSNREIRLERYYVYYAEDMRRDREENLLEELDAITNRIFLDLMERAGGETVWVPLSGGLDSRLVLCKFKQLGYDDVRTFSYGPPGNYEAKAAKEIARRVGVPWRSVPVSMREARDFFFSETRKRYWEFSDGLSNVPNMQDIQALCSLLGKKGMDRRSVVVNGQSGDFITGGHIPPAFMEREPSTSLLLSWTLEKHYSQWSNLMNRENRDRIAAKVMDLLSLEPSMALDRQSLAGLYEIWEWQERQCKYVVSGQRIYDFLGLNWFLPLWDCQYLKFWSRIPLTLKYNQNLYRKYLDRFDFFGCFKNFKPVIWRWPGMSIAVVPAARALGVLFGKGTSNRFYRYMKYIGHYRQGYAPYGVMDYLKKARYIRNPVSLNIETWLAENLSEN